MLKRNINKKMLGRRFDVYSHSGYFNGCPETDPVSWYLKKTKENNIILCFWSIEYNPDSDKSRMLCHNGSPFFGCVYEYRQCEEFNYCIIYHYSKPVLSVKQFNDTQLILRDKKGKIYTLPFAQNTYQTFKNIKQLIVSLAKE